MGRRNTAKLFLNVDRFDCEVNRRKGEEHPNYWDKDKTEKINTDGSIARILGVNKGQFSSWLSRTDNSKQSPIPRERLEEMADLFGCSWEYLCGKSQHRTEADRYKEQLEQERKEFIEDLDDQILFNRFLSMLGVKCGYFVDDPDAVQVEVNGETFRISHDAFQRYKEAIFDSFQNTAANMIQLLRPSDREHEEVFIFNE